MRVIVSTGDLFNATLPHNVVTSLGEALRDFRVIYHAEFMESRKPRGIGGDQLR